MRSWFREPALAELGAERCTYALPKVVQQYLQGHTDVRADSEEGVWMSWAVYLADNAGNELYLEEGELLDRGSTLPSV